METKIEYTTGKLIYPSPNGPRRTIQVPQERAVTIAFRFFGLTIRLRATIEETLHLEILGSRVGSPSREEKRPEVHACQGQGVL